MPRHFFVVASAYASPDRVLVYFKVSNCKVF